MHTATKMEMKPSPKPKKKLGMNIMSTIVPLFMYKETPCVVPFLEVLHTLVRGEPQRVGFPGR